MIKALFVEQSVFRRTGVSSAHKSNVMPEECLKRTLPRVTWVLPSTRRPSGLLKQRCRWWEQYLENADVFLPLGDRHTQESWHVRKCSWVFHAFGSLCMDTEYGLRLWGPLGGEIHAVLTCELMKRPERTEFQTPGCVQEHRFPISTVQDLNKPERCQPFQVLWFLSVVKSWGSRPGETREGVWSEHGRVDKQTQRRPPGQSLFVDCRRFAHKPRGNEIEQNASFLDKKTLSSSPKIIYKLTKISSSLNILFLRWKNIFLTVTGKSKLVRLSWALWTKVRS